MSPIYFEVDGKLHRASWIASLGTHYETIWNPETHAWDHQGSLTQSEIAVARKLEISTFRASELMNREECPIVAEVVEAAGLIDHHECKPELGGES